MDVPRPSSPRNHAPPIVFLTPVGDFLIQLCTTHSPAAQAIGRLFYFLVQKGTKSQTTSAKVVTARRFRVPGFAYKLIPHCSSVHQLKSPIKS
jgi:hypothetical protein